MYVPIADVESEEVGGYCEQAGPGGQGIAEEINWGGTLGYELERAGAQELRKRER
jgi:hypothetical protein